MSVLTARRLRALPFSNLSSPAALLNGLRLFWFVVIVWCEIGVYYYQAASCPWPDSTLAAAGSLEQPVHVLLVSDPKIRLTPTGFSLAFVRQWLSELALKRSWNVVSRKKPSIVIFMGDMLYAGRGSMPDAEYEKYFQKFKEIFRSNEGAGQSTPTYYIPGNNDVGLGVSTATSKYARRRFMKHFGLFNQQVTVRNHTLVLLDAPGLADEDYTRSARKIPYDGWNPVRGGTVEFVKELADASRNSWEVDRHPTILFSHIPLWRPETASCGPLRERGNIHKGAGSGYLNMFGKQTTAFLLETIRPSIIFSGDDQDYCEYTHTLPPPEDDPFAGDVPAREVTVKSFAVTKGLRAPGFELLSLVSPSAFPDSSSSTSHTTFADAHCTLPNPFVTYPSTYLSLGFLSVLLLFIMELRMYRTRRLRYHTPNRSSSSILSISPVSYKDYTSTILYPPSASAAPESAVWTATSPSLRLSPHSPLPPSLRSPKSSQSVMFPGMERGITPTLRATHSVPGTPLSGSAAMIRASPEEDEEMAPLEMPVRYHGNGNGNGNGSMMSDYEHADASDHDEGSETSYFLPPPSASSSGRNPLCSWSFVLLGRRRRISIPSRLPGLRALAPVLSFLSGEMFHRLKDKRTRRHSVVRGVVLDAVGVAWSGVVLWLGVVWWASWVY